MNPYVKNVKTVSDHELEIVFENGDVRIFDVTPFLDGSEFRRLRNPALFRTAHVVARSVEWPEGLDPSCDTLYLKNKPAGTADDSL